MSGGSTALNGRCFWSRRTQVRSLPGQQTRFLLPASVGGQPRLGHSRPFVAKNVGADVHELVIVKGDDPALLPVDEDGVAIEEDLPEGDFVGEIALVDPGTEQSASFDLDTGSYIPFCNILTQIGTGGSHFQDGMVNTLTVT